MSAGDARVLDEAAAWLLRMHDGDTSAEDIAALERWCKARPEHEQAWQRAQQLLGNLRAVPAAIGRSTLQRPESAARRRALKQLAVLIGAAPLAWAVQRSQPWQHLAADISTATGEQRELTLPDGTRLVLNTASAVDLRFDARQRLVQLRHGEILITTAKDARPLFVATAQGRAQPIGTRFSVRQFDDRTEVAVFEGAVELQPSARNVISRLDAGQRAAFTRDDVQPAQRVAGAASLWAKGMMVVENIALGDLVAELDRYRVGRLRCDPQVATLRISGAFPVSDIPHSLQLIRDILPVQVRETLPYWSVVEARR